ncbi:MAG TPA: DUF5682 family protein [Blastocatellia bacterium]|nr:DUF5682 family protein [Blastocatellia bacterium]
MSLHIFGIRHHGPGSARGVCQALESLRPDLVLVEGPPDAAEVLPLLIHPEMQPPVALLIYVAEAPRRSAFYPFATFSPEWQALRYALAHDIPARFMDLPQTHRLALDPDEPPAPSLSHDPLQHLAAAAGYRDGESWWEQMIEERREAAEIFSAILEAMTALRESTLEPDAPIEAQREAFMRQTIRAATREGFERIAVICGAWHAPAINLEAKNIPPAKEDAARLKGLPKVKVQATWTPWTNGRLSLQSGYGAGVTSPGWYQHLWSTPNDPEIHWMAQVARLLRAEEVDVSPAHLIEAVRLAETLAALRGRSSPGLVELNEVTQSVLCFGSDVPLRLIHDRLIVGERLGQVPTQTPIAPLPKDLAREQKRLRLTPEAGERRLDLDLRNATDLDRSRLLHRLLLLGIPWGELQRANGSHSTFHELWQLRWRPEYIVALIEAGVWGSTIAEAATACARQEVDRIEDLAALTAALDRVVLADLPEAAGHSIARLQSLAALDGDAGHLMEALPPLVNIARYGNVRQTDTGLVAGIVKGLVARICVGLPAACASLNDEAAAAMFERLMAAHHAITLLQQDEQTQAWHDTLAQIADQRGVHGLITGRSCRLLLDAGRYTADDSARQLSLALSTANDPAQTAAWIEGFLKGSGMLLLHDDALWELLDQWVTTLPDGGFNSLLPLLRRTFSTFSAPERRQMGERVKRGATSLIGAGTISERDDSAFDRPRAEAVLPLVAKLLGVKPDAD